MPTINQVHVDAPLANISVAYRNAAFVAERIFPVVPVQHQSDLFWQFSKQHFRQYVTNLRPGAEANEIEIDMDVRGNYRCDGHGLQTVIPDEERANADPGAQIDIEHTEKVTASVLLDQEIKLAALLSTTNITQNTTLSGTSQWSDYTNSDPVPVVDAAKEVVQQSIGEFPNVLLLPRPVFRTLRSHPAILDRIKYTGAGAKAMLSATDLAEVFDVEEVIVPAPLKQANPEGEVDSLTYIWGKNAMLFFRPQRPALRTPALGYHFLWTGNGVSYLIKRFRNETRDSDILKIKKYYAQQLVAPTAAYLWVNSVA